MGKYNEDSKTIPNDFCCNMMKDNVTNECTASCECRMVCPDCLICYDNGNYRIIIKDNGHSYIRISFCPWCGKKL